MGAGPSTAILVAERRGIPDYIRMSPLCVAIEDADIEGFSSCFEVVKLASNMDLGNIASRFPGSSGDFFIVGEGVVDVSVKIPSQNKKTEFIREVLCSKKPGDILYVPAVENLVGSIQPNGAVHFAPYHRPTSRKLASLLRLKASKGSVNRPDDDDANDITIPRRESDALGDHPRNDANQQRFDKLLKHLNLTTVSAPYGATLLRLVKSRFDIFEQALSKKRRISHASASQPDATGESVGRADVERVSGEGGGGSSGETPFPLGADGSDARSATAILPDFRLLRVMMTSNIQDYLKRIPFLTKVPMSRIQMLGEMSQFETFPKDSVVCKEGSEGDRVYVVIYGELSVYAMKQPAILESSKRNCESTATEARGNASQPSVAQGGSRRKSLQPVQSLLGTLTLGGKFDAHDFCFFP